MGIRLDGGSTNVERQVHRLRSLRSLRSSMATICFFALPIAREGLGMTAFTAMTAVWNEKEQLDTDARTILIFGKLLSDGNMP